MSPDQQRVGTFLSYKGFQWEPGKGRQDVDLGSMDFRASRQGKLCFHGTILSIGSEQRGDGSTVFAAEDEQAHTGQHHQLSDPLKSYLKRHRMAADDLALPVVAVVVNHEPCSRFKDLSDFLSTLAPEDLSKIHLFIWFDDFKGDKMLFSQTDPELYRKLYNWFHVD